MGEKEAKLRHVEGTPPKARDGKEPKPAQTSTVTERTDKQQQAQTRKSRLA